MMQDMQFHMIGMAVAVAAIAVAFAAALLFFLRRAPSDDISSANLLAREDKLRASLDQSALHSGGLDADSEFDTIFVLPDISHYTKFMAGNRFAFAHARHIIFSLINAMIQAGTQILELSKLEGDAALFFVDSNRHSEAVIGQSVLDIFSAFFRERDRLINANLCPCGACKHIEDLDLKIFVHRGKAARFTFRGAVDHFGTDVIVLHRIMKNSVRGHRYVMVTEEAAESIRLPIAVEPYKVEETVEHLGAICGSVYEIGDDVAAQLAQAESPEPTGKVEETFRKLRQNFRSI